MSEAVVACPVCRVKLRLRGSVLSKATVPCPKCGTTLDVPQATTSTPPPRQKSSPSSAAPPSRQPKQKTRPASGNTSKPKRKRKSPADAVPDPYSDNYYGADEESDIFGGSSADDFDSYGATADPYGTAAALPPKRKSGARSTAAVKDVSERAPSRQSSVRRGGFFSWVGYGALAGIAGIVLQTLLGFTNYLWPLLIATIVTGTMVGTAVRYAAGENDGWGPGIVAVLIAAFAIFAGRVGAFSVSPDVDKILGNPEAPLTAQEAEARVNTEITEPFLIADIAAEVEYDDDFLQANNIEEDEATDYWLEHEGEEDPSKRYLPAIWAEATQRWNQNSPEQKEAIRKTKEMNLRETYGVMSDEVVQQRINDATTDEGMMNEIANSLYHDEQWLNQAGISEDEIDNHWEQTEFEGELRGESQHLPAVWAEAKRRWDETPPEQKQAQIDKRSASLRGELVFSAEDAKNAETIGKTLRILMIVIGAIFTLFWGIGSLICTGSALVSAFKIASGMNVGN